MQCHAAPNNGMHPTPRHAASQERRMWARVMPGVRWMWRWGVGMKKAVIVIIASVSICGTFLFAAHGSANRKPAPEQPRKAFPNDSYEVFTKSQQVTLYSLEPEKRIAGKELFHGYSVLGETEVSSQKLQSELKSSLVKAMAGAYGAACFNPRHGLRLLNGDKTVDIVICFECGTTVIYYGEAKGKGGVFGTPARLYNRAL